jgi:hypothetical protein
MIATLQRQGKPTPGRITSIRSCGKGVKDVRTAIGGVGDVLTIWTTSGRPPFFSCVTAGGEIR